MSVESEKSLAEIADKRQLESSALAKLINDIWSIDHLAARLADGERECLSSDFGRALLQRLEVSCELLRERIRGYYEVASSS